MPDNYNPYEDKTLHTTKPEMEKDHTERQGFNDVIQHYDSVNGFQYPKRMDQIPRPLKGLLRWFIILNVGGFLVLMICQLIESLSSL